MAGNIDEEAYMEQYASIVAAQEAYIGLKDDNIHDDLSILFLEIKYVKLNDKERF